MDRAQLLLQQGHYAQAESILRRALASAPHEWIVNQWLAEALFFQNKPEQAIAFAMGAAKAQPARAATLVLLGQALMKIGKTAEASDVLKQAAQAEPSDVMAWNSLGVCHMMREEMELALAPLQRAMELAPNEPMVAVNLSRVLAEHCRSDEAFELLRYAHAKFPIDSDVTGHLAPRANYLSNVSPKEKLGLARLLASQVERADVLAKPAMHRVLDAGAPRPLRIGLISYDLRAHSCAYFVRPILTHVDRSRATLHCFSTNPTPDAISAELAGLSDSWTDVSALSHEAMARTIADVRIDVLIELGGYTMGNSLDACAYRPAPLQATAIGYPGTLGMRSVTHRFVDAITDPPSIEADQWFSERLVRIEGCFLCYDPFLGGTLPAPREVTQSDGPSNGPVRFGSFNAPSKITDATMALWASVLRRVEGSTLLLKGYAMGGAVAPAYVRSVMQRHGVDPSRLDFAARFNDVSHHLRAYDRIDIALDTTPYVGTTTTCEALLMGVPVVTLAGTEHVSRVGASLLTHADVPELIAESAEQYVEVVARLASERDRLARYHATLRDRLLSSRLCDGRAYGGAWLNAVERAWRNIETRR